MKTGKNHRERQPALRLLVLVPHRDARLPLRAWSASLFAAGQYGAWSFPWVAPLAVLSRLLTTEELKRFARTLREHIVQNGGKFFCGMPDLSIISRKGGKAQSFLRTSEQGLSVFGPSLQIELPDNFFEGINDAVLSRISQLVIGSGVLANPPNSSHKDTEEEQSSQRKIKNSNGIHDTSSKSLCPLCASRLCESQIPKISFRAAALANMSFRALKDGHNALSYEWKIGTLHWLPKAVPYTKSTTTKP